MTKLSPGEEGEEGEEEEEEEEAPKRNFVESAWLEPIEAQHRRLCSFIFESIESKRPNPSRLLTQLKDERRLELRDFKIPTTPKGGNAKLRNHPNWLVLTKED
ncbi:hypothetical protein K0M31_008550 [Melipona bicolor]|uniref:Uncharacterized protein n=1 Tax=Melipona bicolor TaxID=60889 RepID=A0AA40KKK2_9HYME|nr:hypothetical protein K0M31_008550 [Melipona bicolor]